MQLMAISLVIIVCTQRVHKWSIVTGEFPIKFVANLFGEYSFTESVAPFENRHTDYNALKKLC